MSANNHSPEESSSSGLTEVDKIRLAALEQSTETNWSKPLDAIPTVSATILGLSAIFITTDLTGGARGDKFEHDWVILVSWILFTVAIVFQVISLNLRWRRTRADALELRRKAGDDSTDKPPWYRPLLIKATLHVSAGKTDRIHWSFPVAWTAAMAFIAALIFLMAFAYLNLE